MKTLLYCFLILKLGICQAALLRFVAEDLPPYHFYNAKGQLDGALVEVLRATLNEAGLTADIELMPMARARYELDHKHNTLMFSLLKTAEREHQYQFLGATYHATAFLFGLKQRPFSLHTLDDAKKYHVSTIRGYHSDAYLKAQGFSEDDNLVLLSEYHSMWQMLYLGRTDLVLTNALTVEQELLNSGLEPSFIDRKLAITDFPSELHIAANLNLSSKVAQRISSALQRVKDSGRYEQILTRWQLQ
ncbi:substrate-binding periplasmic protein [Pseudoalteromonas fenneropenaei]|uniref:Substrate-binding periplasmic protein n=1 Tax=Pseudoalteromonas fenneropenaei TaxID=1737459 RepID=A0ABV7CEX9_9GAMM